MPTVPMPKPSQHTVATKVSIPKPNQPKPVVEASIPTPSKEESTNVDNSSTTMTFNTVRKGKQPIVNSVQPLKPPTKSTTTVPAPKKNTATPSPSVKGGKTVVLDEDGMNTLVNTIVGALSSKFVSRDEVGAVVQQTLQQMVVDQNPGKKK